MAGLKMLRLDILMTLIALGQCFEFHTSTELIHPRLTNTITLTCDLNGSLPAPRYVTTKSDVKAAGRVTHVTSITITRDGSDVATVTKFDPAKSMLDPEVLTEVRGSLEAGVGENGSLVLVWEYPDEKQAGEYQCEVSGITDHGHCVSFSRSLTVNYTASPSIDDLVSHIYQQQKVISAMQATIDEIKETCEKRNDGQVERIQSGNVTLEGSDDWAVNRGRNTRSISATVRFPQAYTSPPVVSLSLSEFEAHQQVSFNIKLLEVDETEFTMVVENRYNHYNSNYKIERMAVNWLSFPTKKH